MNRILIFILFTILLCQSKIDAQSFPKQEWAKSKSPTFNGWNVSKLSNIEEYIIDSTATTGMMVIQNGEIVYQYGNISENSYIASCRKSILAMLYGKHVENKTINLQTTLEELKITNDGLLTPSESTATIKDILTSRSGIYLPAANGGDMTNLAPERGMVKPGELWIYNNWDFNMAGYIFEKLTNNDIYDEIETQLAVPLEFQDWDRSLQEKDGDGLVTNVLAYHIYFSTRDMARIGLLMLNNGKWNDKQIIPETWIKDMIYPHTSFEELDKIAPFVKNKYFKKAYGYMWWLLREPKNPILNNAYSAQGAWGQNITVIPSINVVVVIKTNDLYLRQRGDHDYILDQIANAYNPKLEEELKPLSISLKNSDIETFVTKYLSSPPKSDSINYQNLINSLAYYYLNEEKHYKKALRLFELNVNQFPNSWLVYDGIAEAYYRIGDLEQSLKNYQMAIKLNVDNNWDNNTRASYILNRIKREANADNRR